MGEMTESSSPKRVIVNADDFGFSAGITAGILRAHREGLVTSTTVAANMPGASDAVALLPEVPELGVGVHLNLSQGPALSEAGRAALGGEDGVMRMTGGSLIRRCLCRRVLGAVEAECEAQIRWVLDHGIRPTHLDSHRHAHAFPPIFRRVARLARRYDIPFVRWHGEKLPGVGWPTAPAAQRRISRALNLLAALNARAGRDLRATAGTWGVAHTGRIDADWLTLAAGAVAPGTTEIMTHPGLGDDVDPGQTRLLACRKLELDALCDPAVAEAFKQHNVELIHYGHL